MRKTRTKLESNKPTSKNEAATSINKAMTDIVRIALLRHDDISMLRQLLRSLY